MDSFHPSSMLPSPGHVVLSARNNARKKVYSSICTFENDCLFLCFKSDEIMKSPCSKGALRKWMLICALSNTSCQLVRGSAAQKLSGVFHSGNKNHRAQGHVPVRTRLKNISWCIKKYLMIFELWLCLCDIDNKYILAMDWNPCGPGSCVHLDWSEKMSSRKLVPFHPGIYIRKSNCDHCVEGADSAKLQDKFLFQI